MIIDAFLSLFATILDVLIGGIIRGFGDPVAISPQIQSAIEFFQSKLYLINVFLPITELVYTLLLFSLVLTVWAGFKLTMWILDILRIGKSYQK